MTYLERIKTYCHEQLEPGPRLILSLFVNLFIYALILVDFEIKQSSWVYLIPTFSTFFLLLYYRISDEFKDAETDAKFFPDRPIPSGRLFLKDLKGLLVTVSLAGLVLNFIYPFALFEFFIALIFTFAMGKWFFMKKLLSGNRLLAFLTHAPVGFFLYWYSEGFLLQALGVEWSLPEKLLVIGYIVLPGLSWEILRKTYRPEDEMPGYQIYSTMLGFRGSLAFAAFFVFFTLLNDLLLVTLFESLNETGLLLTLLNLLLLIIIISHGIRPRLKNLKPIAEAYMALHLLIPLGIVLFKVWKA